MNLEPGWPGTHDFRDRDHGMRAYPNLHRFYNLRIIAPFLFFAPHLDVIALACGAHFCGGLRLSQPPLFSFTFSCVYGNLADLVICQRHTCLVCVNVSPPC
jgi:hypothetical protein